MAERPLPSPEELRQLVDYNPETGQLFWKPRPIEFFAAKRFPAERAWRSWNTQMAGKEACKSLGSDGYLYGGLYARPVAAHRIAWAIVHGEWPNQIDHINGVRTDNRLCNLRNVDAAENHRNYRYKHATQSGCIGVVWISERRKWRAAIGIGKKKMKHLGYFENVEDAIAARLVANIEYGYHANHGLISPERN